MIFESKTNIRKIFFRLIVFILLLIPLFVFFNLGVNIVESYPLKDYSDSAKNYYEYYYSSANDKKIALTFDDGPSENTTLEIINELKKYNVPATFFFIGKNATKHEDIVKEVYDSGFEIGNHSFSHRKYIYRKEKYLKWELLTTSKIIEDISGKGTTLYRPPYLYGLAEDPTINPNIENKIQLFWAAHNGFIPVGADLDPKDFLVDSPEKLLDNLKEELKKKKNAHIVLLHDGTGKNSGNTAKALPLLIKYLRNNGYQFVKVSDLLGLDKNFNSGLSFKNTLYYQDNDLYVDNEVSKLQEFLLTQGYFEYPRPTGYYGNITKKALAKWKKNHKGYMEMKNFDGSVLDSQTQKDIYISSLKTLKNSSSNNNISFQEKYERKIRAWVLHFLSLWPEYISVFFKIIITLFLVRIFLFLFLFFKKEDKSAKEDKDFLGKLDIIIPAYNEEKNIEATIKSILKNNYSFHKIIVVDDGSTDNTVKIVKSIQKKHKEKIELIILNKNSGKAHALNIGFKKSQAEIIVALDGDTIFKSDALEYLVQHFKDSKVGAVAGNIKVAKSFNIFSLFQSIEYIIGQNIEKKLFAKINAVGVVPGALGAWRRSSVLKAGAYKDDTLVEDQDLTLEILKSGDKIIYEERAISYTEVPNNLRSFVKQRFRWVYGTIQCFWKNKKYLFSNKYPILSWIVLPNILFYNILIPLFSPLVDIIIIIFLFFGLWQKVVFTLLFFVILDLFYAFFAFRGEKDKYLLFLVPFQRIFYRQILYFIIIKSIIKAIEGSYISWIKIKKNGSAQRQFALES